ncbi:Hypothetical protein CINCED_3A013713 [Cinara cedri]|uniref:Uncharacterized protein n=1 Tax=Cinara cedri TaxID=506608 RepID=A0A5E4MDU6_9HEMI|nr:Hypothetical protein CINCED_3A013713 [Cinara cedri]
MSVVPQDSNDENENHVEPLDAVDLKCCGEILFELFTQFKNSAAEDDGSDCSLSSNSYCSIGEHLLRQRFDGLYDLMSHDLVGVDECYRTLPKHRLYVELDDFTKYVPLHEMNRYVFGDETYRPKDFSKPKDKRALEVVRTWRKKFENKITRVGVPDSLIETYKTAADNGELSVRDLAMVAFAAFNFLT